MTQRKVAINHIPPLKITQKMGESGLVILANSETDKNMMLHKGLKFGDDSAEEPSFIHAKNRNSTQSNFKKRGQAPIWGWFQKVMLESGEKPTHAECSTCGTKVSIINCATTPMINHMKRHHEQLFKNEISNKLKDSKRLATVKDQRHNTLENSSMDQAEESDECPQQQKQK